MAISQVFDNFIIKQTQLNSATLNAASAVFDDKTQAVRDQNGKGNAPSKVLDHQKKRYPVADAIANSDLLISSQGSLHARGVAENDGNFATDGWSFSYGIYNSALTGDTGDNLLVLEGHSSNKTKTRAAEGYALWAMGRGAGKSNVNLGGGGDTVLIYATGRGNYLNYAIGIDDRSNFDLSDGSDSLSILLHAQGDETILKGITFSEVSLGKGNDILSIDSIEEPAKYTSRIDIDNSSIDLGEGDDALVITTWNEASIEGGSGYDIIVIDRSFEEFDISPIGDISTTPTGSSRRLVDTSTGAWLQFRGVETIIFNDHTISSSSTDTTPPTLQSTTATSNQLILKFSEDIQIAGGGTLNSLYMTITVDGQTRKVTRSQILPPDQPSIHTASQLALTLSGQSLVGAQSVSFSYNPPSNGSNTGFITDLDGNALASIASQVVDTYSSSSSISTRGLSSAYKNLILTGIAAAGYGNIQDNTITGNDANNTLDGRAGADSMIGKGGNDTYFIDNAGDAVTEIANEGTDTVQSTITYTLADNLENLTLLGSGAINGTGNSANNIITGNTAANVLNGNGGTDSLIGSRGNDTYIVDSTDDNIAEAGTSSDVDSVQSSVTWILGINLENLTLTGSSAINGTGNNLNNIISGNAANNILDGGNGGTDRLTGLEGADTFRFTFRPSSFRNTTADHITDFSSSQGDKIQITKSAFGITGSTATLSVVNGITAVNTSLTSSSQFIYDTNSGELHWNQNGSIRGAGSGGVLAILDNKASLSSGDLVLV
jgi:Ca2+-binding RTX toxin-like protein